MLLKRFKTIGIVVALLIVLALAGIVFKKHIALSPIKPVSTVTAVPVRLKIPALKVDAAIESLGITPDGAMDVPKGPADVAWFNLDPRPGQYGTAVIAGHRGWKQGKTAVFDDLYKLRPGDIVTVQDSAGKSFSFVVRESRTYKPNTVDPEVFSSTEGTHLNLITCTGIWDTAAKSSSQRLVVFTDLVK
jgi:sortase A